MKQPLKTSVSLLIAVMLTPLLATAGCHRSAAPTGDLSNPPGIVVSHARLVLPAVKGNPGAAYFTVGNESGAPATLVRVTIVGAQQAQMHQTSGGIMQPVVEVGIDPGKRVIFAPSGKHVMVFSLAPSLAPGGSTEIVLHFKDGKSTSAPLRIEAADSGSGMMGMAMDGKP
jgi:hypothetical protein